MMEKNSFEFENLLTRKFLDIEQNTPEWEKLRRGKFTASMFKDLFMAKNTMGYEKAIYRIAFEKITDESPEKFTNEYMQRGHELEIEAKSFYSNINKTIVNNGGFFELNEWVGASPDGLINDDGLVEIKCPAYNTIINYLIKQKVPSIYEYQIQGQLYVTGREFCDFFAYHPALKPLIIRVKRDEEIIINIHNKLQESIKEVKKIISLIR